MPATHQFQATARPVPPPVCPCCKRPDDAVLEQVARIDRVAPMWHCPHCQASWLHRPASPR